MTIALQERAIAGTDRFAVRDRIRAFGPRIDALAAANEDRSELAPDVIDLIHEAGIFHLMVPAEIGGGEAHPDILIDAISELAYFDGSAGWFAHAVMTGGAVAGANLGDTAIDAIFRSGGRGLCAGQAAPTGKAERVDGGYRVSGRFSFASGSPAATYLVGGYVVHEGGQPAIGPSGQPVMLIGMVPRDKVEFLGNWDVLGLRGTGSYDFAVPEQVIHEDFFFDAANQPLRRGGTLYRMGFMAIPSLSHAAFAIGCARRAVDEWTRFARTKPRGTEGLMARDFHTTQRDLATATADLRAMESYIRGTYAALYDAAAQGAVPDDLRLDGRLCASHAFTAGTRIVQAAFASCTTTAVRNGSVLQRCLRDMLAGAAHFLTGEQSLIDAGRVIAGVPDAQIVF
jgi:alkylation response protein AidB-like acyl-CoA dehydrogenase